MCMHVLVAITLLGFVAIGIVAQTMEIGIVGRVPPAVSVQLTLGQESSLEAGICVPGTLVAFAEVYPG